jgi:UDP-glucose 6-dehydrogenase
MNICVFGLWHLGPVTGACLAKLGHKVVGLDFDKEVVKGLQNGKAPLFEPGLNELISEQVQTGRLSFSCVTRVRRLKKHRSFGLLLIPRSMKMMWRILYFLRRISGRSCRI